MRWVGKVVLIGAGIILGSGIGSFYYLEGLNEVKDKSQVAIGGQFITADIADSERERSAGLAGRDGLKVNEGMFFVFDKPGLPVFWMKGMKFPIDIVWIRRGRIVGFTEGIPPSPSGVEARDLPVYLPPEPVDSALEVAAGRVRLFRANVGDEIKVRRFLGGFLN